MKEERPWDVLKQGGEYKFRTGETINTYEETIDNVIGEGLEKIRMLFDMVFHLENVEVHQEAIVYIGLALVRDMLRHTTKFDDFAQKHCGTIFLDRAMGSQPNIGAETILAARFVKAKPKARIYEIKPTRTKAQFTRHTSGG